MSLKSVWMSVSNRNEEISYELMPELVEGLPYDIMDEEILKSEFASYFDYSSAPNGPIKAKSVDESSVIQLVPKAYRKWCVKFQTTQSVRTGFPAVIQHAPSELLKYLKPKTWNNLTSAKLSVLFECRMRSAAKMVEQALSYWYLSWMEWFSLRPQYFYAQ
jgi:hypothetical protein